MKVKILSTIILMILPSRFQQYEKGFLFCEVSLHSDHKKIDLVHNQDNLYGRMRPSIFDALYTNLV